MREFFNKLIAAKIPVTITLINASKLNVIIENYGFITRNTGKEIRELRCIVSNLNKNQNIFLPFSSIESIDFTSIDDLKINNKPLYRWSLASFLEKQIKEGQILEICNKDNSCQKLFIIDFSFFYQGKRSPYKEITMLKCLTIDKKTTKCIPIKNIMYLKKV